MFKTAITTLVLALTNEKESHMATKAKTTKKTSTKGRQPAPKPAPEPIKMLSRPCLVPNCPRAAVRRGLCHPCAAHAGALVRAGLTTWEALEAEGKATPLDKEAPKGDLPHRQAWLLGQWTPGNPWPPPTPAPEPAPVTVGDQTQEDEVSA